jgi:indolepyruvate ferredoxin oxidoreductase
MDGTPAQLPPVDLDYRLEDGLLRTEGRVYLTGTQALVRAVLAQRRMDQAAGLDTAGFASGYRGSPLAGVDLAMWRSRELLEANRISFLPAINEDMAATMLMGTQQVGAHEQRKVDGVFGLWYGKGPGLERAGDALHHGTAAGASRHGGVLVVVGDDHTAVSSSIPHASEHALIGWKMPIVHPASVEEYELYALWGWALSRYAGTWVAFKAISETVESGRSFSLPPPPRFHLPADLEVSRDAIDHTRAEFLTPAIELRMMRRLQAVDAYARANSLDVLVRPAPQARVGVITVGKAHLDLMETLRRLGADGPGAPPVRVLKLGLAWPVAATSLRRFARGLQHVLVVEEKDAIVETQVKDVLFNAVERPTVCGRRDLDDAPLIPAAGQLRPSLLAAPLSNWLLRATGFRSPVRADTFLAAPPLSNEADGMRRRPYFCPGCPHNTSTRVPEGSHAQAGVGCHYMASWMERDTGGLVQMGGEGVDWAGLQRYTDMPHVFQNMGEGTYYHSGYLAIRQAIAAGVDITYKILFNDAVAMTGGQPVDGPLSVPAIVRQMLAEGVRRIVVTTDEPERYRGIELGGADGGVSVHHRRELDGLQRELRATRGVTVLIHDQTCAAEKRRRRKHGAYPAAARRLHINTAVCEGCGDCGVQSNCLAVVPVETPYGRKRAIDQSSCNQDFSCADGFCPSFVSVVGGRPRKQGAAPDLRERLRQAVAGLPEPALEDQVARLAAPCNLLVAGVGGTGVITIGALVSMAAHLQGSAVSTLDLTGLAQKGGTVISHLRITRAGQVPRDAAPCAAPVRVDSGQADVAILCDAVAAVAPDALGALHTGHTRVVLNTHVAPPSEFTRNPDAPLRGVELQAKIAHAAGAAPESLDAHQLAVTLFGDSLLANVLMLGYAWQRGWIPASLAALRRAIELNGVACEANLLALDAGRLAAHDPAALAPLARPPAQVVHLTVPDNLEQVLARHSADLIAYQGAAYARRYVEFVRGVARREAALGPSTRLSLAVARNLYKLMAYKDEYEVARLYTDGTFAADLAARFEPGYTLRFHMAPPVLARRDPRTGVPAKMTFGPWMHGALKVLARLRALRGSPFDPFGYTAERRAERALPRHYEQVIEQVCEHLDRDRLADAVSIASLPDMVRGYGHIKAASLARYRARMDQALRDYHDASPLPRAPLPMRKSA